MLDDDVHSGRASHDSSSPTAVRPTSAAGAQNQKLQLPLTTNPPGPQNPPKQLVWMIFGATGHMGRAVAKTALSHGDKVTSVGQTFETALATVQSMYPTHRATHLGLLCDVRVRDTVRECIEATLAHWGHIDIIANCAGYGVIGACEDQDEHEIRDQFETNFMGALNIIQLSLPYFRERCQGRYLIFSSTSGSLGVPGLGPYCATKYAVEGLIESMLYEVDNYNIKATLVEPGHMRRDEPPLTSSSPYNSVPPPEDPRLPLYNHFLVKAASEPYATPTSPAAHARRILQWLGDHQPTSAVKSAELIWQLGHCSFPPLRLLLGSYAVESIRDRLRSIIEEIEDWKHLNFPPAEDENNNYQGGGGGGAATTVTPMAAATMKNTGSASARANTMMTTSSRTNVREEDGSENNNDDEDGEGEEEEEEDDDDDGDADMM